MAQAEYVNNAIRVPITGAGAGLPTSPIKAAHAESVAVLTRSARRHIACSADPIKLKASAVQLNRALSIVSVDGAATIDYASEISSWPSFSISAGSFAIFHPKWRYCPVAPRACGAEGPMTLSLKPRDRRRFIGGSDARIIMGDDEAALIRLWKEKRGEIEPEDLSGNLIVQLGLATEKLNRRWYQANTGRVVTDVQMWRRHPTLPWMAATLDGRVEGGDVFESKFMLPWQFSEEAAAAKHAAQLQHNMWVVAARGAILSVISGGGRWVEIKTHADPLYQHLIVTAERKFWRCVETGEPPVLFGAEPPKPRIEAVRIVDMTSSNAWAELAAIFSRTRAAHLEHEQARAELKGLVPDDAQQAIGHGVRAKRSKSGAISFDLVSAEDDHAAVQ